MHLHKSLCVLMAMVLGTLGALLPVQQARADDRCTAYVVDEAGIFGRQKDQLAASVKSLEDVGADGRVIAIQSFGRAGSLDTYIDQMARSCSSWQMSGKLKQNFFALVISMSERKTTIYYGTLWKSRFDRQAASIQSSVMAPLFKQSRYADGMMAGINSIKQAINAPANPSGNGDRAPQSEPAPSTPFPWGLVLTILGWIIAAAAVTVVIIVWVLPWLHRRRESRQLRNHAAALKEQSMRAIEKLRADMAEPNVTTWFEDFAVVGGQRLAKAKESQANAQNYFKKATDAAQRATDISNPKHRLDDEQWLTLSAAYQSVLDFAGTANGHLESVAHQHSELIAEANKVAAQVAALDEKLKQANTALLELGQKGFDTSDLSADLQEDGEEVGQYLGLQDASAVVLIGELPLLTEQVEVSVLRVFACLEKLDSCQRELAALPALHQAAVNKRLESGAAFERMSTQYDPGSWENIAAASGRTSQLSMSFSQ